MRPQACGRRRLASRSILLGIAQQTLKVSAVLIIASHFGDVPVLPELLGQIPLDVEIGCVAADGAYDTRNSHEASLCAVHTVFLPRRNAKPSKAVTAGAMARNEMLRLRASKFLGRALWRRKSGYSIVAGTAPKQ